MSLNRLHTFIQEGFALGLRTSCFGGECAEKLVATILQEAGHDVEILPTNTPMADLKVNGQLVTVKSGMQTKTNNYLAAKYDLDDPNAKNAEKCAWFAAVLWDPKAPNGYRFYMIPMDHMRRFAARWTLPNKLKGYQMHFNKFAENAWPYEGNTALRACAFIN